VSPLSLRVNTAPVKRQHRIAMPRQRRTAYGTAILSLACLPQEDVLLGGREAGLPESLADQPIGIEVDLPVVVVVAVGPDRKDRAEGVKLRISTSGAGWVRNVGDAGPAPP
jgi:hypothetical protein